MPSSADSAGAAAVGSAPPEVVQRVRSAVAASLARIGLIRARRKYVVAVSGGADSLCLLDAMVAVTPRAARRLVVGHVDHQLRPASREDAEHVQRAAEAAGLPCVVLTVDVPTLAAEERRGVEEAARVGRYRALRRLAQEHGHAAVVTGHTADDTVETVLLHLLRGSGRSGLGGIAEREQLTARALGETDDAPPLVLVRPLVTVGRADTQAYCEARGINWRTDESNTDPRMLRNRVRGHLLPVLRTYNPAIGRALTRTAAAVTDDERWLTELIARLWRRLAVWDGCTATLTLTSWRRQPVAAQRRLVRHFAEQIGYWEIGFDAVERALQVGAPGGPPRTELGGGVTVERRAGQLRFQGPPGSLTDDPATIGRGQHDDDGV